MLANHSAVTLVGPKSKEDQSNVPKALPGVVVSPEEVDKMMTEL